MIKSSTCYQCDGVSSLTLFNWTFVTVSVWFSDIAVGSRLWLLLSAVTVSVAGMAAVEAAGIEAAVVVSVVEVTCLEVLDGGGVIRRRC